MRLFSLIVLIVSLGFGMSLQDAINLAIRNNTSVRLSELDLRRAQENIRQARAGILPQISLSYNFTHLDQSLAFGFTPRNRHSYTLELTQNIFNMAVFEGLKLAREQEELQKLIYEDVVKSIELQTKQLFYALLYKKKLVELYEENLRYWEENYRQVEGKFQAGVLPKVELMRAKAQLESARAQLESAKADYLKSLESFKAFLRYDQDLVPEGELQEVQPPQLDYSKALEENNSTLRVARANLRVYERLVEVQKAQYYPSLQAFVNYQGSTVRSGGGTEFIDGYSVGVRFGYNLFDGFARESKIAQAKIDLQKQRENLLDLGYNLRAQLKSVLLELQALQAQLTAVKASLESAEESLRLSTERYRYGVASQLEVLDARNNYNNALLNYYLTLLQLNSALAQLERLIK